MALCLALRTRPGAVLGESFTAGGLDGLRALGCTLHATPLPASTQLRCRRSNGKLGHPRSAPCAQRQVIRPRAHVACAGPDAISSGSGGSLQFASRAAFERFHPGGLETSSLYGCEALAAPTLAAGSRSCYLALPIGGQLVASSPLRPALD